ncbi:Ribosome-recycling factor, chloroplastic [Linum grandiflorum]
MQLTGCGPRRLPYRVTSWALTCIDTTLHLAVFIIVSLSEASKKKIALIHSHFVPSSHFLLLLPCRAFMASSPFSLRSVLNANRINTPSTPVTVLFIFSGNVLAGLCHAVPHHSKVYSNTTIASLGFWSSPASQGSCAAKLWGKQPIVLKRLSQKIDRFVRFATMEEIEAEKTSIEQDAKSRMEKTIETLRNNFNSVRTGRANPAMLDKIQVEYYGSPVSLKSIAQISSPDASSLLVQPYDKSSLKIIEKAIVNSDLGVTPNNDGEVIRLSVPQLTSERRKVALRNVRRDALKAYEKLQKEKKLSEDNVKDLSGGIQKLIDEYTKKVDSLFKQKEKELLQV